MAHNGDLHDFSRMRYSLLPHIRPEIAQKIRGNTDSEWIYAILLSRLADPGARLESAEIMGAVEQTLQIIRDVRDAHGIRICSPVNLFISDGDHLVAVRYTFDFGCYDDDARGIRGSTFNFLSLWYTSGTAYGFHDGEWKMVGGARTADSFLIASEPLTRDTSTWLEIPEYSVCTVAQEDGRQRLLVRYLDV